LPFGREKQPEAGRLLFAELSGLAAENGRITVNQMRQHRQIAHRHQQIQQQATLLPLALLQIQQPTLRLKLQTKQAANAQLIEPGVFLYSSSNLT